MSSSILEVRKTVEEYIVLCRERRGMNGAENEVAWCAVTSTPASNPPSSVKSVLAMCTLSAAYDKSKSMTASVLMNIAA